jgi:hypothetical protein
MGEIEELQGRVEAARREYAALPREGWGEPGPVDERTGERWDRGNVLGHVAEMLPFWTAQVRGILAGGGEMGRDEVGMAQRRVGIDSGREAGEDGLLIRVDEGLAGLQALLADLRDADLDRPVRYHASDGERDADLRYIVKHILVGHAEEHLEQLRSLEG